MGQKGPDFSHSTISKDGTIFLDGPPIEYPKPKFEGFKGQLYKDVKNFGQYIKH